jgi:hypothetical protein
MEEPEERNEATQRSWVNVASFAQAVNMSAMVASMVQERVNMVGRIDGIASLEIWVVRHWLGKCQ